MRSLKAVLWIEHFHVMGKAYSHSHLSLQNYKCAVSLFNSQVELFGELFRVSLPRVNIEVSLVQVMAAPIAKERIYPASQSK